MYPDTTDDFKIATSEEKPRPDQDEPRIIVSVEPDADETVEDIVEDVADPDAEEADAGDLAEDADVVGGNAPPPSGGKP